MKPGRLNYVAMVVAAVVYWLLGAAWYTILSKPWLAGVGKTQDELMQSGHTVAPYFVSVGCDLVLAYVLAWVVIRTGEQTATRGVKLGALLWLGMVATTTLTNYAYEGRTVQFFAINAGYALVGMLVMGAIVGGWKKKEKAVGFAPTSA